MNGLFIPEITAEMFRNGCLESVAALMAEGEIYDIEYSPWIPVSERMPEYDEDVIITHKGTMGQPITSVSYFDGDFRTEDGEGYFSEVIAWMPLPKPYKEESEGSE